MYRHDTRVSLYSHKDHLIKWTAHTYRYHCKERPGLANNEPLALVSEVLLVLIQLMKKMWTIMMVDLNMALVIIRCYKSLIWRHTIEFT